MMSTEAPSVDMWALYNINTVGKYKKGWIVLLGDAAHFATPHQAGGIGQCTEDALAMSELLGNLEHTSYWSITDAFKAYNIIR